MKRFVFVILAAALAVGCGDSNSNGGTAGSGGSAGTGGGGGEGGGGGSAANSATYTQNCNLEILMMQVPATLTTDYTVDWSGVSGDIATTSVTVTLNSALLGMAGAIATLESLEHSISITNVLPDVMNNSLDDADAGETLDTFFDDSTPPNVVIDLMDDMTDLAVQSGTSAEFAYDSMVVTLSAVGSSIEVDTSTDCEAATGDPVVIETDGGGGSGGSGGSGGNPG
jgi:hypothetical protein